MELKFASLLLTFFITSILFSQNNYNSKSFEVTKGDLEAVGYIKDSIASSLVIFESGSSYIDDKEFNVVTDVKRKIKILNREGFKDTFVTFYITNYDSLNFNMPEIQATTYNLENGKIVKTKLNKEDIFIEENKNLATKLKFTFPNVKVGSVFTYSYKLSRKSFYKYREWEFQSEIPKLYTEYKASIPGNFEYNIKLIGHLKLDNEKNEVVKNCFRFYNSSAADCSVTTYIMRNIPAFIEEDFMTAKSNYISRIEYEIKQFKKNNGFIEKVTKDWKTVDKEFKRNHSIGKQLKKHKILIGLLDKDIIETEDLLKKAKLIYKFVINNYKLNYTSNIKETSIENIVKNKTGNASEINILLHNFLDKYGINVKPILLSTRQNGFITKLHPVINDFNYFLVHANINGKTYLLDGTSKFQPFGVIPYKCLNQYGRLLDFRKGSKWIDIETKKVSSKQYKLDVNFDETIKGNINVKYTGYYGIDNNIEYSKSKLEYIENHNTKYSNLNIESYQTTEKKEDEFSESFTVNINPEIIGTKIYFNPFIIPFFDQNPFKLDTRNYPIDFGHKNTFLYRLKLDIDKQYEVLEIPEQISLTLPQKGGSLILNINKTGNQITVFLKFNLTKPVYTSNYYPYLKEFFNNLVEIQKNSLIILKKK